MARRKTKEKKSNFVTSGNTPFDIYKRGALLGGVVGLIAGLIIGKKIIWCIVGGAMAGGYINFNINKDNSNTFNLKKFNSGNNLKTEDDDE